MFLTQCLICSVFDAKHLIGRKFNDVEVQSDIKHFPFLVFSKAGKPYIRVEYRGEQKEFVCILSSFVSCIKLIYFSSSSLWKRFHLWFSLRSRKPPNLIWEEPSPTLSLL